MQRSPAVIFAAVRSVSGDGLTWTMDAAAAARLPGGCSRAASVPRTRRWYCCTKARVRARPGTDPFPGRWPGTPVCANTAADTAAHRAAPRSAQGTSTRHVTCPACSGGAPGPAPCWATATAGRSLLRRVAARRSACPAHPQNPAPSTWASTPIGESALIASRASGIVADGSQFGRAPSVHIPGAAR